MSRNDYEVAKQIESTNPPFMALIMAAIRKADSANASLLQRAWPETVAELNYRYWSAGGLMPGEDGYTRDGDDNLPVTVTDKPPCICGTTRSIQCVAHGVGAVAS